MLFLIHVRDKIAYFHAIGGNLCYPGVILEEPLPMYRSCLDTLVP